MWSALDPHGAMAFTDGRRVDTVTIRGADVFWGFSSGAVQPDFGSECAAAQLIGTPCAPGATPSRRYNMLLVRAGPVGYAGRFGLAQRRWRFDTDSQASDLYRAAGILENPIFPDGGHSLLYEWGHSPTISLAALPDAFPITHNSVLFSALPQPTMTMSIPANWRGDRKWLQVSSGWFVPPITGDYMFSVYCRSDRYGNAFVILSADADPIGASIAAYATGYHSQYFSRWLSLEQGRHYYSALATCESVTYVGSL